MNAILEAAQIIAAARRSRTPLGPLPADAAPRSEAEGYLIQDALHGLLASDSASASAIRSAAPAR